MLKKKILSLITSAGLVLTSLSAFTSYANINIDDTASDDYQRFQSMYTETDAPYFLEKYYESQNKSGSRYSVDRYYISNDRENEVVFVAEEDLLPIILFNIADGVTENDIHSAIRKALGKGDDAYYRVMERTLRSFAFEYKYEISALNDESAIDKKRAVEIFNILKENGYVTDVYYTNKLSNTQYWYGQSVLHYDKVNSEIVKKYVEENLEGYTLQPAKMFNDPEDTDMSCVIVVPDGEKTIAEQLEISEMIYNETGCSPFFSSPCSLKCTAYGTDMMNYVEGDANCNGECSISDAVAILQFLSNSEKYPLSAQGEFNADFDGDGITGADALTIQKMDAMK